MRELSAKFFEEQAKEEDRFGF